MKKIRILLADDHTIVRDGLRALLSREPDLEVVAEAENGRQAVSMACQLEPDVVVIDIGMPLLNGLEATRQIRKQCPSIRILMLSMHEDEDYIRQALEAGAMGYLLKESDSQELIHAIHLVHQGESVLSPAITRLVIEDYLRWGGLRPEPREEILSPREREVLQLIAEGYTNKQIAALLTLSIKTIQAHRLNLMQKLDLHDRGDLIKYAIQKKIIEI